MLPSLVFRGPGGSVRLCPCPNLGHFLSKKLQLYEGIDWNTGVRLGTL